MSRTSRRVLVAAVAGLAAAAYLRVHAERRTVRPEPVPATPGPGPAPPPTPPAASAAEDAPAWEPAVLTRLAGWVPDPPAAAGERVRAYVTAAPLTLAGLAAGLLTGVTPRVHEGALLFERAGGPLATYLRARRFSACTLGHVIIATGTPSAALLAHELVHVRQAERLGILMAPLYVGLLLVYGYRANPLERAARLGQRHLEPASPRRE